mmetsp:Transcript_12497/g.13388  ORF Transcript_12497/g.13388 Transcript_12497/m.13388 type:complete len:99 (+) Transcript_12497:1221-1517(+)
MSNILPPHDPLGTSYRELRILKWMESAERPKHYSMLFIRRRKHDTMKCINLLLIGLGPNRKQYVVRRCKEVEGTYLVASMVRVLRAAAYMLERILRTK